MSIALYIIERYFPAEYEYNYSYLNPLAMTNVPRNKIIDKIVGFPLIQLPKGTFPTLQWLIKVVLSLLKIFINSSLSKNSGLSKAKSFEWTKLFPISNDFGNIPEESLKDVVEQLNLNLEKIDKDPEIDGQWQELSQQKSAEENLVQIIDNDFKEIENKLSQIPQEKIDELASTGEKTLLDNLKKIVKYSAKLAEIADATKFSTSDSSVEFSPQSPTLDDYDQQFTIIRKPAIAYNFQQDLIFAYLQVAGPNPLVIEQFQVSDSRLPVTPEQYSQIAAKFGFADSLEAAMADGRLYVADYALLNSLVNGSFVSRELEQQKYIATPVALFAVPPADSWSRPLFPVAISYQRTAISTEWILFTPLDGESWMTAKNIVQMTDSNYHELISHLGRTDLVVEPFIVPTNHLPEDHCVRKLLVPHFEGTVLINYGAHAILVAPGGTVDSLLASSVGGDQAMAAKAAQSYLFNFNEISFPQTLANRRVTDINKLPTYPYRDDGLLIWNAIEIWVRDYFNICYRNDSAVESDTDLQTWGSTLVSLQGGRLQNFGDDGQGKFNTINCLVKTISTVIFTASAQHAAVNFSQQEMMYTPAFPLARYLPAPINSQDPESFIKGLPSLSQAQKQIDTLYLLGSVYYTQLGKYSPSAFPNNNQLQAALKKFQDNLQAAETTIKDRNRHADRLMPYEFFLPSQIPQSINI
ncbi:MAG: lipoxygenase [Okeania sp. SIO2C2]|uniref:lipoxygenase family protein n=1 Tax=Okeania sp. SIO2C2 TaxID=2607787 RepID=UPI0013B6B77C|nr:lipoxygenase family protein [Okeania sp. SIO2C2]NEP88986.1 lipoxygenase [Okeania sp. SIO2C2]